MAAIRKGRLGEAAELAGVQERASVGALAHSFPPERYPFRVVPFPPHPLDVGYTRELE
jgi:hypothetical protein